MINCDKCRNNLSAFIDDESSELEAKRIREHLNHCSDCQRQYNELKSVKSSLSSLRKLKASPSFDIALQALLRREIYQHNAPTFSTFRFRIPAFAAAAVLMLLVGALIGRNILQSPVDYPNTPLARQNNENALQTFRSDAPVSASTDINPDSSGDRDPVRVIYFVNADGQLQQINERQVVTVNYRLPNQQSLSRRSQPVTEQTTSGIRGMVRQANIQTVKF